MPAFWQISGGSVQFMGLPLIDEFELQVVRADCDRARVALRDDADAEPPKASKRDTKAVVSGETLHLNAFTVRTGDHVDLPVCQDAVDVEDEDLDLAGAEDGFLVGEFRDSFSHDKRRRGVYWARLRFGTNASGLRQTHTRRGFAPMGRNPASVGWGGST